MTTETVASAQDEKVARNPAPVHQEVAPMEDIVDYLKEYARQKPETAALVCIGIGFVLGWKLKPW